MQDKIDVVLVGIGGQGIISLARVIADAVNSSGRNVIVSETHGLSQRGGSVIVHVRLGDVEAPLIAEGDGDVMIALEPIEAARYASYLRQGSTIVMNDELIPPPLPNVKVPDLGEIVNSLETAGLKPVIIPAVKLAEEAGIPQGVNMVLLGASIGLGLLGDYVSLDDAEDAVRRVLRSPERNIMALRKGFFYVKNT
ncbi:MAG: indolepyruvate oxidoreductase subunit beta [Desulfurococcales archaeon]|nr:indolepyruvate oxidoreductase subunit beta [Desulfurococcales archaeon]